MLQSQEFIKAKQQAADVTGLQQLGKLHKVYQHTNNNTLSLVLLKID